jgi:hypothetical protein
MQLEGGSRRSPASGQRGGGTTLTDQGVWTGGTTIGEHSRGEPGIQPDAHG